jgi:hypothetical protein
MSRKQTNTTEATRENKSPKLIAWHVAERGEKAFWTRIGAAFDHKDGEGFTLQLDLIPASSGRIVLRAPGQPENGGDEADA